MKYILFLLFTLSLNAQEEVKLPLDSITKCELRYLYFPNIETYYDSKTKTYLYKVNSEIIESNEKPKIGYSLYNGYFVQITNFDSDNIFDLLEEHKKLYPYISSRRGNKWQQQYLI